jgi:hypothetical protein
MITAGDIQFEPPAQKVFFLTRSIAVMASGDLSFHSEIMNEVIQIVQQRVVESPDDWWNVKDVVHIYINERNKAKINRSEAQILAPLNLDRNSFLSSQKILDSDLIDKIAQELINFKVPDVSTIIMGVDQSSGIVPHIYTVHNDYVSCDDVIGFSAIGSGARHAESQFMLARHAWNRELPETLLLTYSAKKDAEIAPGVGTETDMFMIGPGLGQSSTIIENAVQKLESEYRKLRAKTKKAQTDAMAEVKKYVNALGQQATAAQAEKPSESGGKTLNGPAAGDPPKT